MDHASCHGGSAALQLGVHPRLPRGSPTGHERGTLAPHRLRTSFPDPGYRDEYTRTLACPVDFDVGVDELLIETPSLSLPQPRADERLREVLRRGVSELEPQSRNEPSLAERLQQVLAEQLPTGQPRLPQAARSLAMSARSLHRALAHEGTSFKGELDVVRSQVATRLLLDPRISLAEIARALGFADTSALCRAFRRWHKMTPSAWRRRQPRVAG
ncbi:MAG: AraC family transcriptional regulator [Nannocystaceae bacterium]|nr:AraC family transcriptional regulator [Nannocystaceae bacterium]